jgi:AcrR family transcriptional regulator
VPTGPAVRSRRSLPREPTTSSGKAPSVSVREPTPYQLAARELLRNTLLDAARAELRTRDWSDITMGDIALAAGISRQTLYKEFGSREQFAQALVLREGDRFLLAVEQTVGEHLDDPERALSAAFTVFLTAAAEDPLVRTIVFGDGGDGLLALVTIQGKAVVDRAAQRLAAIMTRGWPEVALAEVEPLAQCLVRLAISYAGLPTGTVQETAASVMTLLGPYVERVTTAAASNRR